MNITIIYYGAFRTFGKQAVLDISSPLTVRTAKDVLVTHLGPEQRTLIHDSVLTNETDILNDDFVLDDSCILSILPPVCGG